MDAYYFKHAPRSIRSNSQCTEVAYAENYISTNAKSPYQKFVAERPVVEECWKNKQWMLTYGKYAGKKTGLF
jgi:hypothetical protein